MLSGGLITYFLNQKGKKVTLMLGCACLGLALPIFGQAVDFSPSIFVLTCITCRLFIGFGSSCINSASNSIIAFNYPDKMSRLIGANQAVCSIGMIVG
jgi:MFS family permease